MNTPRPVSDAVCVWSHVQARTLCVLIFILRSQTPLCYRGVAARPPHVSVNERSRDDVRVENLYTQ